MSCDDRTAGGSAAGRAGWRLAAALLLGWLATGCGPEAEEAPQLSRVAAVKARPGELEPSRWCDSFHPGDAAPLFELPPVEPARPGESLPPLPRGRWIWINLWATWCAPCLREMPLLENWRSQLEKDGVRFSLWYLSVDEETEVLTRFLRMNPKIASGPSLRLKSQSYLEPWLKKYGLEDQAAVPIHLLVGPEGRVRCVHMGQLHESDYPLVKLLLQ